MCLDSIHGNSYLVQRQESSNVFCPAEKMYSPTHQLLMLHHLG